MKEKLIERINVLLRKAGVEELELFLIFLDDYLRKKR